MHSSWITPKARKGLSSAIAGRGLFATEPISAGEIVAVKGGHIVTTQAMKALPDLLQNSGIQITDELHLVALPPEEYEPVMLFLDHSCEPDVGFGGNVVLVAVNDVEPGQGLTIDYAMYDDYDGQMTCDCATTPCRGVIDGHDWRRRELQDRYRGYFSWYLQRKIDALSHVAPADMESAGTSEKRTAAGRIRRQRQPKSSGCVSRNVFPDGSRNDESRP